MGKPKSDTKKAAQTEPETEEVLVRVLPIPVPAHNAFIRAISIIDSQGNSVQSGFGLPAGVYRTGQYAPKLQCDLEEKEVLAFAMDLYTEAKLNDQPITPDKMRNDLYTSAEAVETTLRVSKGQIPNLCNKSRSR